MSKNFTPEQILQIIENADKRVKEMFDKHPNLPEKLIRTLSSNKSVKSNDSGYDADSSEGKSRGKQKKKNKSKKRSNKPKKKSKKRSRR